MAPETIPVTIPFSFGLTARPGSGTSNDAAGQHSSPATVTASDGTPSTAKQITSEQGATKTSNAPEVLGAAESSMEHHDATSDAPADLLQGLLEDPISAATLGDHTFLPAPSDGALVVNGVSMTLGAATTRYQTFYSYGTDGVIVGSSTLDASAISGILRSVPSEVSLDGTSQTSYTEEQDPVKTAVVSIGSVALTAIQLDGEVAVIASHTVSVDGPVIIVSGLEISIGSTMIVARPTASNNVGPESFATLREQSVAFISELTSTFTAVPVASSGIGVVVDTHTPSVVGSAFAVQDHTLSMASDGLVVIDAGSTHTVIFSSQSTQAAASMETITVASIPELSTTVSAVRSGAPGLTIVVGEKTMSAGGSAVAIGTQTLSVATDGIVVANAGGTRTEAFSIQTQIKSILAHVTASSNTAVVSDVNYLSNDSITSMSEQTISHSAGPTLSAASTSDPPDSGESSASRERLALPLLVAIALLGIITTNT